MLERIDLRHFKCFEVLKLPLRPLTLLSGVNASGKSSVLQALVLLHQTMREHEWSSRLMLNGSTISLGTVADVIDQVHGQRTCWITLVDDAKEHGWELTGDRAEMSLSVARVRAGDVEEVQPEVLRRLLPSAFDTDLSETGVMWASSLPGRLTDLTYLTAERLGPRETYPLQDPQHASIVGPRGEHAVSMLYWHSDSRVADGLAIASVPPTLQRQIEARMSTFFPGCELTVQKVPQTDAVTLGLRTSRSVDFQRPMHVGFGLTQVLPIVVAALSAQRDDLFLIENPEVHLHPAGQATMGEFLAAVAAAGVQIFSPVEVTWRPSAGEAPDQRVGLDNFRDEAALEETLRAVAPPIRSWDELRSSVATRQFEHLSFAGDCFRHLDGVPFARGAAERFLVLLDILERLAGAGIGSLEGKRINSEYFMGPRALFSDSSDSEKRDFHNRLTFPHPDRREAPLFCTWHGKVSHQTLRLHYWWSGSADEPAYVVYAGPKITKR